MEWQLLCILFGGQEMLLTLSSVFSYYKDRSDDFWVFCIMELNLKMYFLYKELTKNKDIDRFNIKGL